MALFNSCKHEGKFGCQSNGASYVFYCKKLCGFTMQFDPVFAGSIKTWDWYLHGIAFVEGPSPDIDWKKPVSLVSHEVSKP